MWGCHGARNVGDDAICISLTKTLEKIFDYETTIYVYTKESYIEKSFNEVERSRIRFVSSITQTLCAFLRSKTVIIDGGDHIHDYGAILKRLKVLAAFFLFALATRLTLKKLFVINGGFRATTAIGLLLLRMILSLVSCVSTRDKDAFKLVSKYVPERSRIGFDTSVLMNYDLGENNTTSFSWSSLNGKAVGKNIGISVSPVFSNFFSTPEKDELLVRAISKDIQELLINLKNVNFYFLAFNGKPRGEDLDLIKRITLAIDSTLHDRVKLIAYGGNISAFISKLSSLDAMVCWKYHSIIFSYLLRKPMIIINYHPKNAALANEISLSDRAVLSLEDILNGKLRYMLLELLKDSQKFKARLPIDEAKQRALSGIVKCISCE